MNEQNERLRPEVSPQQAAELVARARSIARGSADASEILAMRESLELRIQACNRWIALLGEWVSRGLLVEAASVDESYPSLCRVASTLAMPEDRLAWDQACNRAGVPANSRIDDQALSSLSDAIGDASGLDDFVQRFQVAVLGRRPLAKRISALHELLAAAPRNAAVRELAKRYETEALASLEAECRTAAAEGQVQELVDALDSIEGLRWESHFSDRFLGWLRDEIARHNREAAFAKYRSIAVRAERAHASGDLMLLGALLEEFEDVERMHAVEQDEDSRALTRAPFEWAASERSRLRTESEHADSCEELRRALDQGCAYTELEPVRGRVLSHGIGIPDDLEARFETAYAQWRSARRRKTAAIVVTACAALGAAVAGIAWLSREAAERDRARSVAKQVADLSAAGEFEDSLRLIESSLKEDPWMAEVAEFAAARTQVSQDAPKYAARRTDIRRILSEPTPSDEPGLVARIAALQSLTAKSDLLERPEPDEASAARARMGEAQAALDGLRELAVRRRAEEFADLRRTAATVKGAADRPQSERASESATRAHLAQLRELESKVRAFLAKAPADAVEREEAAPILDRVVKDIAAEEALLPRLSEAARLVNRLSVRPASESEYADLVQRIAADFAEIVTNMDPTVKAALPDVLKGAAAARAVEHWRDQVLPAIKASDPAGKVRLPSRRDRALQVEAALSAHIDNFQESPYGVLAREWRRSLGPATSGQADSAGAAAIGAVDGSGISELSVVPLSGKRAVYCRDAGQAEGVLAGMVLHRADLTVPAGQLVLDPKYKGEVEGKRLPTSWNKALERTRVQLQDQPLPDARATWLRSMNEIRQTKSVSELDALGPVLFEFLRAYDAHLADREGQDRELSDLLKRLQVKYQGLDAADWPWISVAKAKDSKRLFHQEDSARFLAELPDFEEMARAREEAWVRAEAEAGAGPVAGVLLPQKAGETVRRASPAELTGTYRLLVRQGAGSWRLVRVQFRDGALAGTAEGAPPFALIYLEPKR